MNVLGVIVTSLVVVAGGALLLVWALCATSARQEREAEREALQQWRRAHLRDLARSDDPEAGV